MENSNSRTFTLTSKVTAEQKAKFQKIANEIGIPLSELVATIMELYHDGYYGYEISSRKERAYLEEIGALKSEIKNLKLDNESWKRRHELLEKRYANRFRMK